MSNQIQLRSVGIDSFSSKRMDIMFYNSIQKAKKSVIIRIIYHLVKLFLLCIFLGIDIAVLNTTQTLLIVFMSVSIVIVSFNLLVSLMMFFCYHDTISNNQYFIGLAEKMRHVVQAEGISQKHSLQKLSQCVSTTVYNVDTGALSDNQGLTEQIRSRYEGIYTSIITHEVTKDKECFDFLQSKGKFGSLTIVIFGIVSLSLSQPSPAELGVLVTFIVLQSVYIWVILIILFIVALSPLLICLFCCWGCFCAKPSGQISVPDSVPITTQIIEKTSGSCPICFQAFIPDQKVIILRCSQKHIFHESCLTHWLRMAQTCPMCRKEIGEN